MLTEEQRQYIIDDMSILLIKAAQQVNLAERYQRLVERFPRSLEINNPYVPLERQQVIIAEFGLPIRYYKSEGGYFELNSKKFAFPHMSLSIEMAQWVRISIGVFNGDERIGGGNLREIAIAQRLLQGEPITLKESQTPCSPRCYTEEELRAVLTEYFALFKELCEQIPNLPERK